MWTVYSNADLDIVSLNLVRSFLSKAPKTQLKKPGLNAKGLSFLTARFLKPGGQS